MVPRLTTRLSRCMRRRSKRPRKLVSSKGIRASNSDGWLLRVGLKSWNAVRVRVDWATRGFCDDDYDKENDNDDVQEVTLVAFYLVYIYILDLNCTFLNFKTVKLTYECALIVP